jgi:predicted trehalose synthase
MATIEDLNLKMLDDVSEIVLPSVEEWRIETVHLRSPPSEALTRLDDALGSYPAEAKALARSVGRYHYGLKLYAGTPDDDNLARVRRRRAKLEERFRKVVATVDSASNHLASWTQELGEPTHIARAIRCRRRTSAPHDWTRSRAALRTLMRNDQFGHAIASS